MSLNSTFLGLAVGWKLRPAHLPSACEQGSLTHCLIQVLDRAAFVQRFAELVRLQFYFSGSWNRCAGATVFIAFIYFFFLVHIPVHYFILWCSLFQVGNNLLALRTYWIVAECSQVDFSKLLGKKRFNSKAGGWFRNVSEQFELLIYDAYFLVSAMRLASLMIFFFLVFYPQLRAGNAQGTLSVKAIQQG